MTGSKPSAYLAPAPVKSLNENSAPGGLASTTGSGIPTGPFNDTNSTDFTKLLQQALEPATSRVDETKTIPTAPETLAPAGNPTSKKTTTEVEAVKKVADGPSSGVDVVREARKYLGVPYVWGGNNPKIGLDCSSFVQHTFRDLGVELPRVARDQAKQGTEVPSLTQAKPGDLIVTRGGAHIGIYLGENKMIHAPRPGESVSIRKLFETDAQIMTIRRIVPAQEPPSSQEATETLIREASVKAAELTASAQRATFNTAVKNP
ncbi:hypothetical protein CQ018_01775 [Arthrobacter sp. MYb227]|nr:hypothetical protein CQ018_01775 [Arthrobacter sp. MYb227]